MPQVETEKEILNTVVDQSSPLLAAETDRPHVPREMWNTKLPVNTFTVVTFGFHCHVRFEKTSVMCTM